MIAEYSRCQIGQRCIIKTDDSFFYRKFTLLVAISNSKCIGWILYEKGGMNKERLVEFMENVWNRDCNGATNIYKIAYNSIHKIDRPSYLCRSNLSGTLDDVSKPKFTHSETGKPC